ncbi:MAG: hypothetical protein U9O53_00480 [archaeon]|nr:hypothetical protein [archaeon]
MKTKYEMPQNQLKIETMRKEHLDIIEKFDASNKELKDFLWKTLLKTKKKAFPKHIYGFTSPQIT